MDRPGLTRALALALCAAAAHAEPAASAELEAVVARAQARLARAPELLKFMDPSGGEVDLGEAAARVTRVIAECRADQKRLSEIADDLAEQHPDPERAPLPALLMRERAAAFRFREWVLMELLKATDRTLTELRGRGQPSPAELLLAASHLDAIAYGREGAALLRRWLEIAPAALERAPREDLATVLLDVRMMAFAWGPNQWGAKEKPDVQAHVDRFRAAVRALPAAKVVLRWWDWGTKNGGAALDASTAREQAKDLRALGLEELARDVERGAAR